MIPSEVVYWRPLVERNLIADLRPELILGIIWQESEGNPWIPRYEPNFIWFYDHGRNIPLAETPYSDVEHNRRKAQAVLGETEFHCQSMSWGLMQIMGAAARERGFRSGIAELTTPECGVTYGIKHLWEYAYNYGRYTTFQALVRYNGKEIYAYEVEAKVKQILTENLV